MGFCAGQQCRAATRQRIHGPQLHTLASKRIRPAPQQTLMHTTNQPIKRTRYILHRTLRRPAHFDGFISGFQPLLPGQTGIELTAFDITQLHCQIAETPQGKLLRQRQAAAGFALLHLHHRPRLLLGHIPLTHQ